MIFRKFAYYFKKDIYFSVLEMVNLTRIFERINDLAVYKNLFEQNPT